MHGRCGNQLFRYAFARALQLKFYPNYHIDINYSHLTDLSEEAQIGAKFVNDLQGFNIKGVTYSTTHRIKLASFSQLILKALQKILNKIFPDKLFSLIDEKYLHPVFNRFGLYSPKSPSRYFEPLFSNSRNIFCACFGEHTKYFEDIGDILRDEFTPTHEPLTHNLTLLDDITNSEAVCVTIRRGDFLSPQYRTEFNVCNEEYFITAMKAIRKEIPQCKFFVFSDDVEDVKRTMHFPFEVTYECGNDPVWEKLRLMYSCKHFIISNSTFSWWAQYLSRNPNKIVYAPTPWHWDREENWDGLYLPYMRTIECHR